MTVASLACDSVSIPTAAVFTASAALIGVCLTQWILHMRNRHEHLQKKLEEFVAGFFEVDSSLSALPTLRKSPAGPPNREEMESLHAPIRKWDGAAPYVILYFPLFEENWMSAREHLVALCSEYITGIKALDLKELEELHARTGAHAEAFRAELGKMRELIHKRSDEITRKPSWVIFRQWPSPAGS